MLAFRTTKITGSWIVLPVLVAHVGCKNGVPIEHSTQVLIEVLVDSEQGGIDRLSEDVSELGVDSVVILHLQPTHEGSPGRQTIAIFMICWTFCSEFRTLQLLLQVAGHGSRVKFLQWMKSEDEAENFVEKLCEAR